MLKILSLLTQISSPTVGNLITFDLDFQPHSGAFDRKFAQKVKPPYMPHPPLPLWGLTLIGTL